MILKRVCSLVTAAFLLPLTLAIGDFACAVHTSHNETSAPAVAGTQHTATSPHDDAGSEKEPCDIPVRPDCCRAHTSCSFSLVLDGAMSERDSFLVHAAVMLNPSDFLSSPRRSPDPPPPKA